MASTTRALETGTDHGSRVAIAVQGSILVLLLALVGGAMVTAARPVGRADEDVDGNAATPAARDEPSSASFVAGPPGGLLILVVEGEAAASLSGVPEPIMSTGGPLKINIVRVYGPEERAAFLGSFQDAESVCGAMGCRATWVVEMVRETD